MQTTKLIIKANGIKPCSFKKTFWCLWKLNKIYISFIIIVLDVMFIERTNYNIRIENYDNEEY